MTAADTHRRRWPWRAIATGSVITVVVVGLCILLYRFLSSGDAVPKRVVSEVVQLKLIEPLPPPPPPPPPKMVEQPRMKEPEVKTERPIENKPPSPKPSDSPKPDGPPALDAKGRGPSDAFDLAGKPGGGDYIGGGGGGGGGSKYGWYAALLESRAREVLQKQKKLGSQLYQASVLVWLNTDGVIRKVELLDSTGVPEVDRLLVDSLMSINRIAEPPPADMPLPITMRVSSS